MFLIWKHVSFFFLFCVPTTMLYHYACAVALSFTMKSENNDKPEYFYACVSVYIGPSISGLGMRFFSFCSLKCKSNCFRILLFRDYIKYVPVINICMMDLNSWRSFSNNFFTRKFIDTRLNTFLSPMFLPQPVQSQKQILFIHHFHAYIRETS